MKRLLLAMVLLLYTAPVQAATVESSVIRTGGPNKEYVPRFATFLPNSLKVTSGQTVVLSADATWDAIEVQGGGVLRCDRTADVTIKFIHLQVLPGGVFDCGTEADPVLGNFQLVVRDVPIDNGVVGPEQPTKDAYQWGNGLVNFGTWNSYGRKVTSFVALENEVPAGASQLTLSVPSDWRVGDELYLPEFHQVTPTAPIKTEQIVKIASILPGQLTLDKPLQVAHLAVVDPDGNKLLFPRVANLTRNVVVRSENPQGVRGHTASVSGDAVSNIRYTAFVGLGRTKAVKLDVTTASSDGTITHLGTNQIARYASHYHFAHGPFFFVGNALRGNNSAKWGHVVHQTHDAYVADNVAIEFVGAGFVTEDGPEIRNTFVHNFCSGAIGNGGGANTNVAPTANCPGCEGSCFWWRGLRNTFDQNEAYNSAIGHNMFGLAQLPGTYPSTPGGPRDTPYEPTKVAPVPVEVKNNISVTHKTSAWEHWNTSAFPVDGTFGAYSGTHQFNTGHADSYLRNVTAICGGARTLAIDSATGYTGGLEVDGGRVAGCDRAFANDGAINYFTLRNLTLQNKTNISFPEGGFIATQGLLFENITHVDLPGSPRRWVVWGGTPRAGVPPSFRAWNPATGTRGIILNWQGTGQNYRLYTPEQRRSKPAVIADGTKGKETFCPDAGMTVGQCWDKYGLANNGGVVDDALAQTLPGFVSGFVEPGTTTPLGPPRYVVTSPNMNAPAAIETVNGVQRVKAWGILTGKKAVGEEDVEPFGFVAIDDKPAKKVTKGQGQFFDELSFYLTGDELAAGVHTIKTWRVSTIGNQIADSVQEFKYFVGAVPPPPVTKVLTLAKAGTGAGTISGGGTFTVGSVVTITATPDAGSTFDGWSTGCETGTVTVDADKTCTATFTLLPPCAGLVGQTDTFTFGGKTFLFTIVDDQCKATVSLQP